MMFSYRTIAGVGAAALAFLALSRVSGRFRNEACETTEEFVKKAKGRMEGIVRRRTEIRFDATNDVI